MRIDFLKYLMESGFTECSQCGKVIPQSQNNQGVCPECLENK